MKQQRSRLKSQNDKIVNYSNPQPSSFFDLSSTLPPPNYLTHYINAIYQGIHEAVNSVHGKPFGLGAVIQNDFTYVLCDNWWNGKLNGNFMIRMKNQILVWGNWDTHNDSGIIVSKVKGITIYLPDFKMFLHDDKKIGMRCLIYNENRHRVYITLISTKQSHYDSKPKTHRGYNVIIQKILSLQPENQRDKKFHHIYSQVFQQQIAPQMLGIKQFLTFLFTTQKIKCSSDLSASDNPSQRHIFICCDGKQDVGRGCEKIGLVLDCQQLITKAIGVFSVEKSNKNDQIISKYQLEGLGMWKNQQQIPIIGIYKKNLIIREFQEESSFYPINHSRLPLANPNIAIRQKINHYHLKALSYTNQYFTCSHAAHFNKILIELYQYVDMFERLAQNHQDIKSSNISSKLSNDNINNDPDLQRNVLVEYTQSEVFETFNNQQIRPHNQQQFHNRQTIQMSSSETIIDKFNDINQYERTQQLDNENHMNFKDDKKPGFIMNKSSIVEGGSKIGAKSNKSGGTSSSLRRNGSIRTMNNNFITNISTPNKQNRMVNDRN